MDRFLYTNCTPDPQPPLLCAVMRIKKETGTSILVPGDSDPTGVIRIEGDPERVQIAKKAVMDLANKMVRKSRRHASRSHSLAFTYCNIVSW